MKILKLRFKNLNSLYGEWEIDFTAPDYASNGIFAITGPTGAGKSTIMDAICLALYGTTPRLGKITASGNEIMSRQTGECFAEVTFESQAGRFRCHWSQHRARKLADGRLAEARHEIAEADTGNILESKKRDVAIIIEAKTGMDFERFTRSILLAQGSFAAFLKAAPDERAPVLEQITGTEIYSVISQRVHERARDERSQLDVLQAETAGFSVLSDEQEAGIKAELEQLLTAEKELSSQLGTLTRSIQWLDNLYRLQAEITELEQKLIQAEQDQEAFKPERQRLLDARKAAELEGEYAALKALRQQQQSDSKAEAEHLDQLEQENIALSLAAENKASAEAAIAAAKAELQTLAPLIQQIRLLDQQIQDKRLAQATQQGDCQKDETAILQNQAICDKAQSQLERLSAGLLEHKSYLAEHQADETLVTQLAGISEQMKQLVNLTSDLAEKQNQRAAQLKLAEQASIDLKVLNDSCTACQQAEAKAREDLANSQFAYSQFLGGRLLRELEAEHNSLLREMAFLKKIASLENERKKLSDGQPCPLCGAVDHPFAAGNVPEADETEKQIEHLANMINQAGQHQERIKSQEALVQAASVKVAESGKKQALAVQNQATAAAELQRLDKEVQGAAERCNLLLGNLRSSILPYGLVDLLVDDIPAAQMKLSQRLSAWQSHQQQKASIEQQLAGLDSAIKQADAIISTLTAGLTAKQALLNDLIQLCEELARNRTQLFGDKNPDAEEKRITSQIAAAEANEKQKRGDFERIEDGVSRIQTHLAALAKSQAERQPQLAKLEQDFVESLSQAGFADEQLYLEKRLPATERDLLHRKAEAIDKQLDAVKTLKKDRESQLAVETAKNMTDAPRAELQQQADHQQDKLREIGEEIGARKQRLSDNTSARILLADKQDQIEQQKLELRRWDNLRDLIGSADGKKFRNFAQGLTFELMVNHANRQLEKMTDRYLLIRDDQQPLELNVVDNYQAGEIRSTKNLSGGESFIVSLALALGLSKMASRKVRVDSLFLDEGFGTLDEEALETALETLAGLQQDGKLIGVISHVSALKERISTQLKIWPQSGGKSTITGPGVSSVL